MTRNGKPRTMFTFPLTLFALMVCAVSSLGGEIYGTIKEGGKPIAKETLVSVSFGDKIYPIQIDDVGSYRVQIAESGKGIAKVVFNKQDLTCEIQSYATPVRFDLVVVKNASDQYILRRQ